MPMRGRPFAKRVVWANMSKRLGGPIKASAARWPALHATKAEMHFVIPTQSEKVHSKPPRGGVYPLAESNDWHIEMTDIGICANCHE